MEKTAPILLVDDQAPDLEALQSMLHSSGCKLVLARSPSEALLALLREDFAALVLDVYMPEMSGFELAKLIKARPRTKHLPILFLTAGALDDNEALRGYQVGAVDYLTKPINPIVLRAKVEVFCELFHKDQALREVNQNLELRVQERTAELRMMDRLKDEFLAGLAHELRNPLAAIFAATELLKIHTPPGSPLELPEGVIVRQLRQMRRLVDDLLDVRRISTNKFSLQQVPLDIREVLQQAVESSRPIIEQKHHVLSLHLPQQPVFAQGDPVRLAQVFSNLLDNAAKYTLPGGIIKLEAQQANADIVVRVSDSGEGIADADLARIFELFVQTDRSVTDSRAGLGIGLTLVRRIVELHEGKVSAHSAGRGRGSQFVVRLPVLSTETIMPAAVAEPSAPALKYRYNVLIVEDNLDAAAMLEALLEKWNQRTRVVHDGLEAIKTAEEFRPDLIFLDVGLPNADGYQVAREIRAQPWGDKIRIVVMTGWGERTVHPQSSRAGIDVHLVKPVEPAAIHALIADLQRFGPTSERT